MEEEKIETEISPEQEFIQLYAGDFKDLMEGLLNQKVPWEIKEITLKLWASLIVKFLMIACPDRFKVIMGEVMDTAMIQEIEPKGNPEKKDEV